MRKILITGFEPFGKLSINPTMEVISRSKKWDVPNVQLETIILPVVYNDCASMLIKKIEEIQPDIILSLGVAVGRAMITPERIGINIQDTVGEGKFGDNKGDHPQDRLIEEHGPDGLFTTLPIRGITGALVEKGIPAQISNSAGTYICNNTMFSTLHYIRERSLPILAGFIHVPATPEMVTHQPMLPSMGIEVQEIAIKQIVEYLSHYSTS